MDLPINRNDPLILHLDLNSCFATIEQQANPLLRGKPIAVVAYNSPGGCILAPSYEAKAFGVKTGMTVREGRLLCKDLITMMGDPPKYQVVHQALRKILYDYTPDLTSKSIDEVVLDFNRSHAAQSRALTDIGYEIKQRIKQDVGEWVTCNIGIAPNRFLAKLAASLHKPDGLDVINHRNLLEIYNSLTLLDIPGINVRYQARLNVAGIFTPIDFFNGPLFKLKNEVFHSIVGYYWFLRLRGWEIDAVNFSRKSYGQQYALKKPTADKRELSRLLMKLCEKMGRRLRKSEHYATGIHVSCVYKDRTHWHKGKDAHSQLYATRDCFIHAQRLLNSQPLPKVVTHLSVSVFNLIPTNPEQLDLFNRGFAHQRTLSEAVDTINDKFGEFVITPALMMGMNDTIIDRISFGSAVKELRDIY